MYSEIARFRVKQTHQGTSARLGLSGPSNASRHEVIEARIQQGPQCIVRCIAQGRSAEAEAQMNVLAWGSEGEKANRSTIDTAQFC